MLGIDLVYLPEFRKQLESGGKSFLQKAFGASELQDKRPDHLAGIWAAKEAVLKAGSLTPGNWLDIRVAHEQDGRPFAMVGTQRYEISIAHHGEYAVAVAQQVGET